MTAVPGAAVMLSTSLATKCTNSKSLYKRASPIFKMFEDSSLHFMKRGLPWDTRQLITPTQSSLSLIKTDGFWIGTLALSSSLLKNSFFTSGHKGRSWGAFQKAHHARLCVASGNSALSQATQTTFQSSLIFGKDRMALNRNVSPVCVSFWKSFSSHRCL